MSENSIEFDPGELAPRHDVPVGGRSGFLMVDQRQVHYLEWGHRGVPPVLCLHGGGQTAYMFEELGSALGDRYHLVAPDLPGHGDSDPIGAWLQPTAPAIVSRSEGRSGPGRMGGEAFGREALAESLPPVLAAFGFDRFAAVGASLGGITTVTFAARQPDVVAGIVLIDVGHRLEDEGVRKIISFMNAHESFASLEEAATEIAAYLPHRKEVRPESLTRNLRQRPDGRWVWKHGFGRRFRRVVAEGGEESFDWRAGMVGLDEDAAALRCPVLILRGSASDVLSSDGAEEAAALIPDARLATVERAGHLAAGDNPASTVSLVSGFLSEIGW